MALLILLLHLNPH